MKRLEFHISYTCTHRCIFCSEADKMKKFRNSPLSTFQIKTILIDRRKKGYNHVNFTGGEPTILPNFLELLKFTKKLGYQIYVGTSGTMLFNENFCKEALKYIDELSLSVHWFNKESCYLQTGSNKHFDKFPKIIKNIEKYKKNNFFFLNIVINKYNYSHIEKILDFILGVGYSFKQVLISNIAPEGLAKHNFSDLVFSLNDFKNYIPKIIKKCSDNKKILRFFGIPTCILGDSYYSNDEHWEERHTIERYENTNGKVTLIDVYSPDNSRERTFVDNKCNNCKWKKNPCTGVFKKYLDFYKL